MTVTSPSTPAPVDVRPLRERLADLLGDFEDSQQANESLYRAGLTDGLPVVAPTAERVSLMLGVATPDKPATQQPIPPGFVVPTLWDVAASAVLAGCEPNALPLIVAALDAMTEPSFNLLGIQTTTGAAAPLLIINGPVIGELGINCSHNALGPGWRPNATIGRAVRLVLQNVGLAIPGTGDMATQGHPGKYTWLAAEHEAASPWPPFHTTRGFAATGSAVTVVAGVGNVEVVLPLASPDALVTTMAHSMMIAGNLGPGSFGGGQPVVLLPPECAHFLSKHGWERARLQEALFREATMPLAWLSEPGASRIRQAREERGLPPNDDVVAARSPEDILVIVTGGVGTKATFVPTWAGAAVAVTRSVEPL